MTFNQLVQNIVTLHPSVKRIGFFGFLIIIHFILFQGTISFYNAKSNHAFTCYDTKDSLMNRHVQTDTSTQLYKETLKDLYFSTLKMRNTYNQFSVAFNVYQIAYSICLFYSAIILALLSFLVIKKGWDNTDNIYLKLAFLYFSGATSLFTFLPKVFNNDTNV
jgi:hypothetical protein